MGHPGVVFFKNLLNKLIITKGDRYLNAADRSTLIKKKLRLKLNLLTKNVFLSTLNNFTFNIRYPLRPVLYSAVEL